MSKDKIYKQHYACFNCRKAFKKTNIREVPTEFLQVDEEGRVVHCPQCGERMPDVGYAFTSPKKDDVKGWQEAKARLLNTVRYKIQNSNLVNAPNRKLNDKYIEGYERSSAVKKALLIGRNKSDRRKK